MCRKIVQKGATMDNQLLGDKKNHQKQLIAFDDFLMVTYLKKDK